MTTDASTWSSSAPKREIEEKVLGTHGCVGDNDTMADQGQSTGCGRGESAENCRGFADLDDFILLRSTLVPLGRPISIDVTHSKSVRRELRD